MASAIVTAIEQDPTVTSNFNLNQIVNNIRDLTKLEIVSTYLVQNVSFFFDRELVVVVLEIALLFSRGICLSHRY